MEKKLIINVDTDIIDLTTIIGKDEENQKILKKSMKLR